MMVASLTAYMDVDGYIFLGPLAHACEGNLLENAG